MTEVDALRRGRAVVLLRGVWRRRRVAVLRLRVSATRPSVGRRVRARLLVVRNRAVHLLSAFLHSAGRNNQICAQTLDIMP